MIIFCHLLNDNSGSPVVLRDVIGTLAPDGKDAALFVGSQGRGVLEQVLVPIRRYFYRRSRFKLITLLTYLFSQFLVYRVLTKARIPANSIIYVNTLLPFGAAIWAWRKELPILYHVHEVSLSPHLFQRFLVFVARKTASRAIYVSEDNRARLPISGVPAAVVPNPISPKISETGFATPYLPRRSGQFEVLMIASARDYKGVPEFLSLASRLTARTDILFTLVLNDTAVEIDRYLSDEQRPRNLVVHARTDSPEAFYAKADVLLNLSRVDEWIETFGLTIVEGMSFGLPVIAPPIGGPTEIVTDGVDGFLIDSRNGEELDRRILDLSDDPALAAKLSVAARRRAQDFTIDSFSSALRQQIELLVSDARHRA